MIFLQTRLVTSYWVTWHGLIHPNHKAYKGPRVCGETWVDKPTDEKWSKFTLETPDWIHVHSELRLPIPMNERGYFLHDRENDYFEKAEFTAENSYKEKREECKAYLKEK